MPTTARSIWKGHVTFGLVTIPVVLYSAERRTDLQFRLLDDRNNAPIRYERINEVTGEEVPWNRIVKGFEYAEGNYVLLSSADFKRAAVEATKAVEIEHFVDYDEVDPFYFDRPYYLAPGKKGEKGYVLLREALRATGKMGIAKVVIHTRQHLAALLTRGDALVLNLLRFHQELRDPADFDLPASGEEALKQYHVTAQELSIAQSLIEAAAAPWTPAAYRDEYRQALLAWIERKADSGEIEPLAASDEAEGEERREDVPPTFNFTELLKRSLKERQSGRGARADAGAGGGAADAAARRRRHGAPAGKSRSTAARGGPRSARRAEGKPSTRAGRSGSAPRAAPISRRKAG